MFRCIVQSLEKKIPSVFEGFFVSMNIPPKKKRDIMATT